MTRRRHGAVFQHRLLPYLLVMFQIVVTLVFFWPASHAENFRSLLRDPDYPRAAGTTAVFSTSVTALASAQVEWPRVMATTMLAMLPPVAVVVLMQRWFVKGLVETEK